jgi:nitronate monooxygenase
MVYLGTRFIATQEAQAPQDYKEMLINSEIDDIIYSDHFTGVHANYLRASIENAGIDVNALTAKDRVDLDLGSGNSWKEIWSAGHGVGGIHDVVSVKQLVDNLTTEYKQACDRKPFAQ